MKQKSHESQDRNKNMIIILFLNNIHKTYQLIRKDESIISVLSLAFALTYWATPEFHDQDPLTSLKHFLHY